MEKDLYERLDVLVSRREGISRVLAKGIIENGYVKVNNSVALKCGLKIKSSDDVCICYTGSIFISRGGFKLKAAIDKFGIDLTGFTCMDIGAAAGGFTDCMLQNGARKVYAIDVGSGQLKDSIRENEKVVCMENTDFRDVTSGMIEPLDFVCADLSFISLEKILPHLFALADDKTLAVLLVKPQFEAGPGVVNKNGIIKNKKIHYKILLTVYNYIIQSGFSVLGLCTSPILGGSGNKEFLVYLSKESNGKGHSLTEFDRLALAEAFNTVD